LSENWYQGGNEVLIVLKMYQKFVIDQKISLYIVAPKVTECIKTVVAQQLKHD
jgi:hypothetical protein